MIEPVPKYYWDACGFISYVEKHSERLAAIEAILSLAEKGTVEVVTSTITITEVAFADYEKTNKALDPEIENRIDNLWAPSSPINLVDFHPLIAKIARDYIRQVIPIGWSLKSKDAIHLATAQQMSVSVLHTYNDKLEKYKNLVEFRVESPQLELGPLFEEQQPEHDK